MNHNQSILTELQIALDTQAWDEAERLLQEALRRGLTQSDYGIPLRTLLLEIEQQRRDAANRAADELMNQAARLAATGQMQQARALYAEAAQVQHISPAVAQQIEAAVVMLEDEAYSAEPDPALESELERLMQQVLTNIQETQPSLAVLLRACAIPLWWDIEILSVIRNRHDGREAAIMTKLTPFSFIYEWPDYYTYSRLARRILLQTWNDDPGGFQTLNERLLAYVKERLASNPPTRPAIYERLLEAQLYHTFLADPEAGVRLLIQSFQTAENEYRLEAARQYVLVLKELQTRLPSQYAAYIDYAEGWLHYLYQRTTVAYQIFQELAARPDLLPDLKARVQRGLAAVLMARHDWVAATDHYQQALALFQSQGQQDEMAETMIGLGNTHLDIAMTAYGVADELAPPPSLRSMVAGVISMIARLPLILYLIWKLRLPWQPALFWRLGRGMDWVIARLFSKAVTWFDKAAALYQTLGNTEGEIHASEQRGRLYLALSYTPRAADIFRQLMDDPTRGTYQAARARLELAETLICAGQDAAARPLLEAALPVFQALKHNQRIAQTQNLLGHLAARRQEPEVALHAYDEALTAWQRVGDEVRATDIIHAMEAVGRRATLSDDARTLLEKAQQRLPTRVYVTRFVHPWMNLFQRLALVLLFVVLFTGLWMSMRSESGTKLGADVVLRRPIQMEKIEDFKPSVGATDDREVQLDISKQVKPQIQARFLKSIIGYTLLTYILLYTLLGLLIIVITPMQSVQTQQVWRLQMDNTTMGTLFGNKFSVRLLWTEISTFIRSDTNLLGKPLAFWSNTTINGPQQQIDMTGYTHHYMDLTAALDEQIAPDVLRIDTGYTLLRGFFGRLLLGTLALWVIFIALIYLKPTWIQNRLATLPYTPVDLYGLLFIGIGLPLAFWLGVQPARHRLARNPNNWMLPLLAVGCLVLCELAWVQYYYWHVPLGRPDVVLSAMVLLLAGSTFYQQVRLWRRMARPWLAAGVLVTVLLAASLALSLICSELKSFTYLAIANQRFLEAEAENQRTPELAQQKYLAALTAYSTTLAIRPEAYIYNSLGNVYAQLASAPNATPVSASVVVSGVKPISDAETFYMKASVAYSQAVVLDPKQLIYGQNLALAYRQWAAVTQNNDVSKQRFQVALGQYNALLKAVENAKRRNGSVTELERSAHELRAATWFDLGRLANTPKAGSEEALTDFAKAQIDYEWLIKHDENNPAGYVGKGWSLFYARLSVPASSPKRIALLQGAFNAFSTAITKNPAYIPAYNGLGWARYYLTGNLFHGNCIDGFDRGYEGDRVGYSQGIAATVDDFSRGLDVSDGNGYFFRTRAQLNYILAYCGPPYDKVEQLTKSIADYRLAVARDPRIGWYRKIGDLYQELTIELRKRGSESDLYTDLKGAVAAYQSTIHLHPTDNLAHQALERLYPQLDWSFEQALDDILAARNEKDTDENLLKLAIAERSWKNFNLATTALERLVKRNPHKPEAWLQLARAMFAWAEVDASPARAFHDDQAIAAARQVLVADPKNFEALLIWGRAALREKRFASASFVLQQVAKLPRHDPTIFYSLGLANVGLGNVEGANVAYQQGLQATQNMTDTAARVPIYGKAITDLLLISPDPAKLAIKLALQTTDAALDKVSLATSDAYSDSAQIALGKKQYAQAIPLLVKAIQLAPQKDVYWTSLRTALVEGYNAGQIESGNAVLNLILEAPTYETLLALAHRELAHNTFGLALAALDQARTLRPDSLEATLLQAQAYLRFGEAYPQANRTPGYYQQAVRAAQAALKLDANNQNAYLVLGQAYHDLGQEGQSTSAYDRVTQLRAAQKAAFPGQMKETFATLQGMYTRFKDALNWLLKLSSNAIESK